jgi:hypothetical protein
MSKKRIDFDELRRIGISPTDAITGEAMSVLITELNYDEALVYWYLWCLDAEERQDKAIATVKVLRERLDALWADYIHEGIEVGIKEFNQLLDACDDLLQEAENW